VRWAGTLGLPPGPGDGWGAGGMEWRVGVDMRFRLVPSHIWSGREGWTDGARRSDSQAPSACRSRRVTKRCTIRRVDGLGGSSPRRGCPQTPRRRCRRVVRGVGARSPPTGNPSGGIEASPPPRPWPTKVSVGHAYSASPAATRNLTPNWHERGRQTGVSDVSRSSQSIASRSMTGPSQSA
jgi:hypothetical protein